MATSLSTAGPHLMHDSYDASEPTTQTASRSVPPFSHGTAECPYTLQWDALFPHKIAASHGRIWIHI